MASIEDALSSACRAESGQIIAALMMHTRDMQLAEDAFQDALLQASEAWSSTGIPNNTGAWLFTVAKRRLIDTIRSQSVRTNEKSAVAIYQSLYDIESNQEIQYSIPEERLRLIFTCCHPAISQSTRVALTLKVVCGLSLKEVARAFFVTEKTMEQRLTRAKRKIRSAGIAYETPEGESLIARLPSVLSVIYLIYNESYSTLEGESLTREEFALEAIRLSRLLYELLPHSNCGGLLALLLLHDARREARYCVQQGFMPLEHQDRTRWNQSAVEEGLSVLMQAIEQGPPDVYKIQAAISALHVQSTKWEETDWQQIVMLYDSLYRLEPSPIVSLNRSMAWSHIGCLNSSLNSINQLENELSDYQPWYVAKAALLERLDRNSEAILEYKKALAITKNAVERRYLEEVIEKLLGL